MGGREEGTAAEARADCVGHGEEGGRGGRNAGRVVGCGRREVIDGARAQAPVRVLGAQPVVAGHGVVEQQVEDWGDGRGGEGRGGQGREGGDECNLERQAGTSVCGRRRAFHRLHSISERLAREWRLRCG